MNLNRRTLLKSSAAASAVFTAPLVLGAEPTTKYRTALIGCGWWGMNILRTALASGECQAVALCDVDQNHLNSSVEEIERLTGDRPRIYGDYRELLEAVKPEIAIVATPDHWHPLITIAAVRSGAHVYVEKPISHTIHEGRAMVSAAREADRVVQVGTHRRVSPHNRSAMEFLRSGKVGKIGMVRSFVHYPGGPGRTTPDSEPPEGLDWEMWCGPAPLRRYNRRIHPRGFRQFLEYANGQLGDWGIHWLDQILWWTEETAPNTVSSTGGRHILEDNTNTPDTQTVLYEFDDFTATWEHRQYAGNEAEKHSIGCYFYGTNGTLHLGWLDGWTFYPDNRRESLVHEEPELHKPDDQNIPELWANFVQCIRTGTRPVCDIEIGHRSTSMALLGMLSLKLGRSVKWDAERETIPDDSEASGLLRRPYREPWEYPSA